jgi:transposase
MQTLSVPVPSNDSSRWRHVAHAFLPDPQGRSSRLPSDVTDAQWELIAPYVHATARKNGRPLKNQRDVLNGVLFVLTNECPWRLIPSAYGNYVTCWRRLLRWQSTGTWPKIQRVLLATRHPLMCKETASHATHS